MKTFEATIIKICLIILLVGAAFLIFSQPPPPPGEGTGSTNTNGNRNGAPIDGGLGILLAMGAAYGGKKLYQAYKKKKETSEEESDELT
ncbi:MAG: hypothetical protein ISS17_06665 [Bacteroidales bacterium]|nr:hypothetical protein [Bacteroidales bacterium]